MSLGHWLNSLDFWDHLALFLLFGIGLYLSLATLQFFKKVYEKKQKNNPFATPFRITPFFLLGMGIFYTFILYRLLGDYINIALDMIR
ncbi:MAG: hypothetical protein HOK52_08955 [Candidatus Marinimicrobia bacterium]|jgi:uncharacterized membrane protein|nr:hypothetical protein [Candidatus Neomarinimicrobiota bacterium]MBT3962186.1 hypothetical protein [Candidatus Neomarinimicrobiota bacterium]MBT4383248.1 hypothetical protein [Candidatus Neomarinimicrobiota bacterium]MBT4636196.1 hypothetical protein [Candidatus Neomarinimicrobiota bacterium]MBT6112522.1 hypothetical protein [Candidatus Neomarinimicrobiota bacterium]